MMQMKFLVHLVTLVSRSIRVGLGGGGRVGALGGGA